jgi:hypothetical protein
MSSSLVHNPALFGMSVADDVNTMPVRAPAARLRAEGGARS